MNRFRRPLLHLGALRNAVTQSLFFLPFTMVAVSVALSQLTVWFDRRIGDDALPVWFNSSVESSRSILSAVAGGTITAASIVFSLTLVAVQLAASQFSPRVLRGFLGDRFQQIVMGTVVGTFSYSLFVLREVESDTNAVRVAFTPQLSIALALVLAVLSLIAILASIDHTAKGLRVGTVADDIVRSTVATIEGLFVERGADEPREVAPATPGPTRAGHQFDELGDRAMPPDGARMVLAQSTGWVTGMRTDVLGEEVPEGTSILVAAVVGSYVVEGTPILHLWPASDETVDQLNKTLASIVRIGKNRTMQQDVGFGIIQLVDIALRALSPGVNDPNTAEEVVVRLGAVLTQLYRRQLPDRESEVNGRRIIRPSEPDYDAYVDLAIEPIRRYGRSDPRVLIGLIRTLEGVRVDAERRFDAPDTAALQAQIDLIEAEIGELATDADRRRVLAALAEVGEPGRSTGV